MFVAELLVCDCCFSPMLENERYVRVTGVSLKDGSQIKHVVPKDDEPDRCSDCGSTGVYAASLILHDGKLYMLVSEWCGPQRHLLVVPYVRHGSSILFTGRPRRLSCFMVNEAIDELLKEIELHKNDEVGERAFEALLNIVVSASNSTSGNGGV